MGEIRVIIDYDDEGRERRIYPTYDVLAVAAHEGGVANTTDVCNTSNQYKSLDSSSTGKRRIASSGEEVKNPKQDLLLLTEQAT